MRKQTKKFLTLLTLFLVVLFAISCNKDNTENKGIVGRIKGIISIFKKDKGIGKYAGEWLASEIMMGGDVVDRYTINENTKPSIIINSDGSITINDETTGSANITDITKNSDTNYSFYYGEQKDNSSGTEITIKVKFTLNFSSDTEGTITIIGEGTLPDGTTISVPSGTYNIIKK